MVNLTIPSNCRYIAVLYNGVMFNFTDSRSAEKHLRDNKLEVLQTTNNNGWYITYAKKADSHI